MIARSARSQHPRLRRAAPGGFWSLTAQRGRQLLTVSQRENARLKIERTFG
jgi:hypothetical protein